jgi:hypothetical protein
MAPSFRCSVAGSPLLVSPGRGERIFRERSFVMDNADRVFRAQITKVRPEGLYFVVPVLGRGVEYGPAMRLKTTEGVESYAVDAWVLVSTFRGRPDDFVVLGVLVP